MKLLLSVLPTVLLTLYGQLVTKYRVAALAEQVTELALPARLLRYVLDPMIVSAYAVTLMGSFAWFIVLERFELSLAYPVFVGVMFVAILMGGVILFNEHVTATRLLAVALIFAGVALGTLK